MQLSLYRFASNNVSTLGRLLLGDVFQCYVCEDAFHAVKVYGKTRIPSGKYEVVLKPLGDSRFDESYTAKFGAMHKGMLQLQGVPGFTGVLIHIGNTNLDTDGCLLVGMEYTVTADPNVSYTVRDSRLAYEKIYPPLAELLLDGQKLFINVVDKPEEKANDRVA